MKSARINFGIGAESEYVLEVDDTGVATRCFNPVTGQELGIGGSDLPEVTAADEGKVLAVNASGEWAAEQYAGYDAVLFLNASTYVGTVLKGSTTDIIAKLQNNDYKIEFLVFIQNNDDGAYSRFTRALVEFYWDNEGVDPNTLDLFIHYPDNGSIVPSGWVWNTTELRCTD